MKAAHHSQTRVSLVKRQENIALAREVNEIAFPVAKLGTIFNAFGTLADRHAVRDRRFPFAVSGAAPSLGLSLRQEFRQAFTSPCGAENVAVDGLVADAVLLFIQFHPPGDDLRGPSHSKVISDVVAEMDGTLNLRASQLARPSPAIRTVWAIAVGVRVAPKFAVNRAAMPPKPSRNRRLRKPHLHQAAQTAPFFQRKMIISRSHSHTGIMVLHLELESR